MPEITLSFYPFQMFLISSLMKDIIKIESNVMVIPFNVNVVYHMT